MIYRSVRSLILSGVAFIALTLTACAPTQVKTTSKDPAYKARDMRRVLVLVSFRKVKTQHMIEDEFVYRLKKMGVDPVASYTLVREGETLDQEAWKQLVINNHFDAVIVSRLVDMKVVEEEEVSSDAKMLRTPSHGNYGYYGYSYVYQPGFTSTPQETAGMETRVFNVAENKMVWSARSQTEIVWGRDPDAQVRDFVRSMLNKIYG